MFELIIFLINGILNYFKLHKSNKLNCIFRFDLIEHLLEFAPPGRSSSSPLKLAITDILNSLTLLRSKSNCLGCLFRQ